MRLALANSVASRALLGNKWNPSKLTSLTAWYDPSDLTILFQDSAGTTPVTSPGQPVGLVLDKSRGLVLGAELVTNGDGSSTSGWTPLSTSSFSANGVFSLTNNGLAPGKAYQAIPTQIGKTYRVTGRLLSISTGFGRLFVQTSVPTAVESVGSTFFNSAVPASASFVFTATATTTYLIFGNRDDTNASSTWDDFSVREIPGSHLIQATAAKRPEYGIMPKGGVRNLLTYSNFGGAAAGTPGTVPAGWAFNSSGGSLSIPAYEILGFSATSARQIIGQSRSFASGGVETWGVTVVSNPDGLVFNQLFAAITGAGPASATYFADGVSVSNTTYVPAAGQRLTMVVTNGGTAQTITFRIGVGASGTATGSASFKEPQAETGSVATAYQKVVSAREVTEAGQPSLHYLYFDGVDDALATAGNVDLTTTDAVSVFAGVRKESDASAGGVVELSTASSSAAGSFGIFAPWTAGGSDYGARVTGSLTNTMFGGIAPAPVTSILSILADISSDSMYLRSNGLQIASRNDNLGTGNFGSYPLYIGARAGTSLYFKGNLYGLALRGALSTADEINSVERWLAQRTGVTI